MNRLPTEGLHLRAYQHSYAPALLAYDSATELTHHLNCPALWVLANVQNFLARVIGKTYALWAIILQEQNKPIGALHLQLETRDSASSQHQIAPLYWQTIQGVLGWANHNHPKLLELRTNTAQANPTSRHVVLQCGLAEIERKDEFVRCNKHPIWESPLP